MQDYFSYRDGRLHAEQVALDDIASRHGTPCYVYSRSAIEDRYQAYRTAFAPSSHLVCYAVKANSTLAILNLLARLDSGFDIVSGGELQRVIAAGGDAGKVVFSGVGKTEAEMRAALEAGILCFNVESEAELQRLNRVAKEMNCVAPVSLRVNPDVDAKTHPYIATGLRQNKFGVAYADAFGMYQRASALSNLRVVGVDCHIGSQLTEISPYVAALEKILALIERLAGIGIKLEHIDVGGGLGINYENERPPSIAEYAAALLQAMQGREERIIVEPGRSLVGNAGLLLTKVEYLKPGEERNFAIVDAAMNDLMRPALYDAWHDILPVRQREAVVHEYEVVGPVCETGDFIGHARKLAIEQDDLLAIMSAGAYGMSMSSNYNSRPRVAEIMVSGNEVQVIRERESVESLFATEKLFFDKT